MQEHVFNWSFRTFIILNLVLEVIDFMYVHHTYINQDKFQCLVENGSKVPSFYEKDGMLNSPVAKGGANSTKSADADYEALTRRTDVTNITDQYDELFQ